jgi:predicted site-specific integrase-resolvase
MATKPELLDNDPAADFLGIKGHTLEIWRASGRYRIPYIKVGSRVKYRRSDLEKFLDARTVNAEAA